MSARYLCAPRAHICVRACVCGGGAGIAAGWPLSVDTYVQVHELQLACLLQGGHRNHPVTCPDCHSRDMKNHGSHLRCLKTGGRGINPTCFRGLRGWGGALVRTDREHHQQTGGGSVLWTRALPLPDVWLGGLMVDPLDSRLLAVSSLQGGLALITLEEPHPPGGAPGGERVGIRVQRAGHTGPFQPHFCATRGLMFLLLPR
ncbi:hypothetical protein VOLCADRAFT_93236 [Volvox carteri f. nagariensis]|uniref:Uncharacterized protein n=1 Tax=Volvox carteri f. nagariensis TaxID=3068 RepID=D8U1M8_VOLCA|nr:uncharacterized protein VOLCADRAFT_93236 [Volvox carteri f. nagariensis]EFJ46440.1 hypothetical protein VOLCADRAFT_93236 [Volvox carteri f. nagariensis]|eukprot:XP_002952593.1 hypothetical protein VOLCADRAFT_93236 [Volvox carteri f. nagariensis]